MSLTHKRFLFMYLHADERIHKHKNSFAFFSFNRIEGWSTFCSLASASLAWGRPKRVQSCREYLLTVPTQQYGAASKEHLILLPSNEQHRHITLITIALVFQSSKPIFVSVVQRNWAGNIIICWT